MHAASLPGAEARQQPTDEDSNGHTDVTGTNRDKQAENWSKQLRCGEACCGTIICVAAGQKCAAFVTYQAAS